MLILFSILAVFANIFLLQIVRGELWAVVLLMAMVLPAEPINPAQEEHVKIIQG